MSPLTVPSTLLAFMALLSTMVAVFGWWAGTWQAKLRRNHDSQPGPGLQSLLA